MKVYTIPVIGCFYVEARTKEEAEAEVRTAAKNAGVELVQVLPSYAEGLGGEDEDTLHR